MSGPLSSLNYGCRTQNATPSGEPNSRSGNPSRSSKTNRPKVHQQKAIMLPINTSQNIRDDGHEDEGDVIQTGGESFPTPSHDAWAPALTWEIQNLMDNLSTDKDSYEPRFDRALKTLKHLQLSLDGIKRSPQLYIHDMKLFRYLGSKKHSVDTFLSSQKAFVDNGIAAVTMNLWNSCINVHTIKQWSSIDLDMQECFYQLLMAVWFICSETESRQLLYPDFLEFLVQIIVGDTFVGRVKNDFRVRGCYKSILGIIYQYVVNITSSHQILYKYDTVSRLQKTLTSSTATRNVRGRSALILAYILTDEQQKQTDADTAIEFLLSLLKSCVEAQETKVKGFNYTALEILEGLNRLAVADHNKESISTYGGVGLYSSFLQGEDEQEKQEAIKGLWMLAFNAKVAEELSQDKKLLDTLQELKKSELESLRSVAKGCLWTIESRENDSSDLNSLSLTSGGHVMISYNWEYKIVALKLKDLLLTNGYRVWIDIDGMEGSTLSAMSQAVEKASVVLVLLSNTYKLSPACRAELEYAYKLQRTIIPVKVEPDYTPTGWLGMILGFRMVFDMSREHMYSQNSSKLIDELGAKGRGAPYQGSAPVTTSTATAADPVQQTVNAPSNSTTTRNSVVAWSSEQVDKWIKDNQLQFLLDRFGTEITARDINELKSIQTSTPKYFYQALRQDLSLNTVEVLRVSAAIRSLSDIP